MIKSLIDYHREPTTTKGDHQETILHVGATSDKLGDLKSILNKHFDHPPEFKKKDFNHGTEYILSGKVGGVDYLVSLEHIDCPVPISFAEIHHALVQLPKGSSDRITPIIEAEFQKYADELTQKVEEIATHYQ